MSEMTSADTSSQPSGAGAMLRQAREAQGMSIDILASIIKVTPAKLLALESEDRRALPNPNFNRALAMTVCRALKVDATPILARMPAAVVTPLASAKAPLNQPFRDFSHTGLTFEHEPSGSWRIPRIPPALMAPVLLLLLAGLIYVLPEHVDLSAWLPKTSDTAQEPAVAASGAEVVVAPAPSASDAASDSTAQVGSDGVLSSPADMTASAPLAGASQPVVVTVASPIAVPAAPASSMLINAASAPKLSGSARPSEALPALAASAAVSPLNSSAASAASTMATVAPPNAGVAASSAPTGPRATVTLSSKEPAWIEVRDGAGQKLFSRQLAAGEQVNVQGAAPLRVHAGNAPAVSVRYNGQPVDLASVTRQNVARIELK